MTAAGVETVDLRSARERRVRSAWTGSPAPALRAAAVLYALVEDARHALYDVGVLAARHPGVPVISVGGLAVGGSGKTPLAGEIARWLRSAGRRTAVITHGFEDEMAVHRSLGAEAVLGGRDRERVASAAVRAGAGALVIDSGFQRRSLARDLDVLAVSTAELAAARRRLPAGPLREGWSAVSRADALVVVRRTGQPPVSPPLARWLDRLRGELPVARLSLRPGPLRPANATAAATPGPSIAVAVCSVMEPDRFLDALGARGVRPEARFVLPDHGRLDASTIDRILDRAGGGGIVGTLKDRAKLAEAVGERAAVWWLEDAPVWTGGEAELRRRVLRAAGARQ